MKGKKEDIKVKGKDILLKGDRLREISKRFESIDEQRFLNSCLVDVFQRELLDKENYYHVSITDYASKQNISLGKAYTELKELLYIYKKTLEIPLPTGETWVTSLIYDFKYDDDNLILSARFNEKIIPYLSGDMEKGTYCLYDNKMGTVPSNKRYIMGEVIQRNLHKLGKLGEFTLSLPYIRGELNLKITEYRVYSDLYKRVIKETLKDLADIKEVYLTAKKTSRGITFTKITEEQFRGLHG